MNDCCKAMDVADALLKVWAGGGWQACLFALVFVAFYRKPWFRDSK